VYQSIREEVSNAAVKGIDETGWKVNGKKRWLWVGATCQSVLFLIHSRRNKNALVDLVKKFTGFLISDRWKIYNHWPIKLRQLCWSHILRNWEKLFEQIPQVKKLRDRWMWIEKRIFAWWYRFKSGEISRQTLIGKVEIEEKYLFLVLSDGMKSANKRIASFCERLNGLRSALLTFVRHEGIEPTNNHTERVQRRAVIWRRTSFGCHSESGCRFVERILSVVETLKLRGQSFLEFTARAIEGYRKGQPVLAIT
jgi:transposase